MLLKVIKEWPHDIYDYNAVASAIKERLSHGRSEALLEALSELYIFNKNYLDALDSLIDLKKDSVFELIEKFDLQYGITEKILPLMQLSAEKYVLII